MVENQSGLIHKLKMGNCLKCTNIMHKEKVIHQQLRILKHIIRYNYNPKLPFRGS